MIKLPAEQLIAIHHPQPGGGVVTLVIEGGWLPLRDRRAQAAAGCNQQQQHDGNAQVGHPGRSFENQALHVRRETRLRPPMATKTAPLIGGIHWLTARSASSLGIEAARLPASSKGNT